MDFKLLVNRKIIDILIGDSKVYDDYTLPRMSGPKLCDLCTSFGLNKKYAWHDAPNQSRWEYMSDLLCFLDSRGNVPDLLTYLFKMERFDELTKLGNPQKVKTIIVSGSFRYITRAVVQVNQVERFYEWWNQLSKDRKIIVLNNLWTRFDNIERKMDDDLPF